MKKWGLIGGLVTVIVGGLILLIVVIASLSGAVSDGCDPSESDGTASAGAGTAGAWTQPGTTAYNNAKATFDSWAHIGASGAAAAGIVGWVNTEGGFEIVDRAEGHYGHDEQGNGVSAGVTPIPSGAYPVGGAGIYQFTPFTKFAPLSDPKWLNMDEQTKFVMNLVKKGDWIPSQDLTGGHHSFREFTHATNPEEATLMWNAYERGDVRYIPKAQKQADARKAYEMFGGANISANDSLLGDAAGAADTGQAAAQSDQDSACDATSGGATDGTGKVPDEVKGKLYGAHEIPDSLKPFLLPINLSDARGVAGEDWAHPGGQCVDYSVSEAVALWKNTQSWSLGNGVDQVNSAIKFGYAVKDDAPHAGDIVSCDGTDPSIGHTWIVGHVFEDGSVLVQEQNFPGKSGDDMGMPKTWDVGVLPPWKGPDSWKNVPNWGSTMNHAVFAKPAHGLKTK